VAVSDWPKSGERPGFLTVSQKRKFNSGQPVAKNEQSVIFMSVPCLIRTIW
jgi:hypothetical protein